MTDITNMVTRILGGGAVLGIGITGITIIFTVVIIFVVVRYARNVSGRGADAQRIRAMGVPAQARIIGMQETGMYVNEMPVANITLEIFPQNGQPPFQTTLRQRVNMFQLQQFQVGAVLPAKFDPSDPSKVALLI